MNFSIQPLGIGGALIVHGKRFQDSRGYFTEIWSAQAFSLLGISSAFVQDNESLSTAKGTLRGLHFQEAPHAQAKLVRVLSGSAFDVIVDIRPSSTTFRQWNSVTLTAEEGQQLFVPRGFAHGFVTLQANTVVAYKVDAGYSPAHDRGIVWNDPDIAVRWPFEASELTLSDKDRSLPMLMELNLQREK